MPEENYYCPDNFFKKMTDLESPKKNNDCYFYYYSTCAKGDNCTFRHEPSALGCETMCSFWKEGKCLNVHCNFRHMELRKNRKVIPCYWESQPVGCLKAHCPFLHQNPRPSDEVSPDKSNISAESNTDAMLKEQMNQPSERKVTAVDSLVVNFEEESDNESAPTFSPIKSGNRIVKVKTLEEIKLEKIQAESAAYYSYYGQDPAFQTPTSDGDDLRQRIVRRIVSKYPQERTVTFKMYPHEKVKTNKRLSNDELATILGDESLRKKQKIVHQTNDTNFQIIFKKRPTDMDISSETSNTYNQRNKKTLTIVNERKEPVIQDIKIKTLEEIRAERNAKRDYLYFDDDSKERRFTLEDKEEAEVSSTSADETVYQATNKTNKDEIKDINPKRKIKLRRKLPILEESVVSSYDRNDNAVSSNISRLSTTDENKGLSSEDEDKILEEVDERLGPQIQSKNADKRFVERSNSNKMEDEVLLLEEDDDEYDNVTLKAEEELLNEIDSD